MVAGGEKVLRVWVSSIFCRRTLVVERDQVVVAVALVLVWVGVVIVAGY